ncbi:conserved hypothetical protein [Pseudomonas sp. 8Z]|uniref:hypothetical protein n=1 Tax=Pseudomonas sp. 8Z TaxID=2653166 RepID=UPI0012EF0C6D|nr:hypothetical protein [Pseudomonas sp. 8Z]VXC23804.1 conserved hypothetical protein [Pseudomonas sp. 8Z]
MNPLFTNLTPLTLENIEDQLANNDASSDEEMFDFLLEELDLTAEQAEAVIALRPQYIGRVFLSGNSPLYQDSTVYFDPAVGISLSGRLTEYQLLEVYRLLLKSRPGKRLQLANSLCAGLNSKGQLYWTTYDPAHPKAVYEVYSFDKLQFDDGHWQGETLEQTTAAIQRPVFID